MTENEAMNSPLPHAEWRLIHSSAATGAVNMAVDEAILEAVQNETSPPTLRLYDWDPACLSLGYAQSIKDVDEEALSANGWEVVRRPTGGRAILHIDEMTYSVIGPDDEARLAGGVKESYLRLSSALLASLDSLSVAAIREGKKERGTQQQEENPVCFEAPSDYEITIDGKKLVGSAQARRKKGVLQHGSLPLSGDIGRITHALSYKNDALREKIAERVRSKATTVENAIGRKVSWDEAAEAFAKGFAEALNISLVEGELSAEEIASREKWLSEKYANPGWTRRN
jgi:lipoate-protein ligase A